MKRKEFDIQVEGMGSFVPFFLFNLEFGNRLFIAFLGILDKIYAMIIRSRILAKALFSMVVDDGRDPEVVARDFSAFIERHDLFDQVGRILYYLEHFWTVRKQEETLSITASMELKDELIERIRQHVGALKEGVVDGTIDENLIGGFVAEYRGTRYDASVKSQLKRLRGELAGSVSVT